jgi:hypothetical protein
MKMIDQRPPTEEELAFELSICGTEEEQQRLFEERGEGGIGFLPDGALNVVGGTTAGRSPRIVLPALEGTEADVGDLEDYEEFERK